MMMTFFLMFGRIWDNSKMDGCGKQTYKVTKSPQLLIKPQFLKPLSFHLLQ